MIKQLLVAVDECPHAEAAIRHGCELAKRHGALLIGLAAADIPGIEAAYHTLRPLGAGSADAELHKKRIEEARLSARNALSKFENICREQGVEHEALLREGRPAEEILKKSLLSDLVLMGKETRMAFSPGGDPCDTWNEVLTRTERPLILVPRSMPLVKKVMIAVDFHRLTDRLLFNYAHLNPYPEAEVHLIHAASPSEKDKELPEEMAQYLERHGIRARAKVLYGEHVGQAVVTYAEAENIDLAVIGLHTMSKLALALMGSTGRYLIEHLKIPLLVQT